MKQAVCISLAVLSVACAGSVDPGTLPCRNNGECPSGAYCAPAGKCAVMPAVLGVPVPSAALNAARTGITLTWPRVPGASSYDVRRSTAPGAETFYANVLDPGGAAASVSWDDPAADAGQTDYYQVIARDPTRAGANSSEVSALTVPAAPANVNAVSTGAGVLVTWSVTTGASGYTVSRDGNGVSGTLSASALSYTDATAPAGGTYAYSVAAIDASGTGPSSAAPSVTTPTSVPTLSITQLANSGTTTSITLTWTRPPGATAYDVYKGATATTEALFQTVQDPTHTYVDVETATAATFHFHVVARNTPTNGVPSNDVAATTVPASPAHFTVDSVTTSSVSLSWDVMPTAANYRLTRSPGSVTVVPPPASGTRVSFVDSTAIQPSAQYIYTVSALDSTGALVSPAASSLPSTATTPTPIPVNLAAAPVDDTHVTLTWDRAPAGVDSYDILRGTSAGGEGGTPINPASIPNPTTGASVTFTDNTAVANTVYFYKVVANHNSAPGQSSAASNEASARSLYPAPTGLTAAASGDNSATLTFTPAAGGPYTYEVLRGLVSGQYSQNPCNGAPANPQTCADNGELAQNTQYFYRVRIHDTVTGNFSLPTNEAQATTTNNSAPGVSVTAASPTTVNVTVGRLAGFDRYDVYRNTNGALPPAATITPTFTINATTATPTFLDNVGTAGTYYYWARARWSGSGTAVTGWSTSSASVNTSPPPPTSLATPSNIKINGAGAGEVLLTWFGDASAVSYSITRLPDGQLFNTNTTYLTDVTAQVGASVSYQITAHNGSVQSAIGTSPSATVASAATSFLCSPPRLFFNYSDAPTVTTPLLRNESILTPTATLPIATQSDGNCVGTGLPAAPTPVWLKRGGQYVLTSNRSMNLSEEFYGRQTATPYFAFTPISLSMGNLQAWTPTSKIELFGSNSFIVGADLQQLAFVGLPATGDTALTNFTFDAAGSSQNLWGTNIDTSLGDKPVLIEVSPATSSNGFPYLATTRGKAIASWSQVDGRTQVISDTFDDLLQPSATTPPTTTGFKYLRSAFKAMATSCTTGCVNPLASSAPGDTLTILGSPKDASGNAHVFSSPAGDILAATFDSGTGDVDMGTIQIPHPYPSTWTEQANLTALFTTPINCGPGNTPTTYTAAAAVIDTLGAVLSKASAGGIGPQLQPVTNPQISVDGNTFLDAFADHTGMGLTPTLRWTVASGLPVPNHTRVFVYKVTAVNGKCVDADQFGNFNLVAQLFIPSPAGTVSFTMPTGILQSGTYYFADLRSAYEPGRDVINKPFIRTGQEYYAETVTNVFTP